MLLGNDEPGESALELREIQQTLLLLEEQCLKLSRTQASLVDSATLPRAGANAFDRLPSIAVEEGLPRRGRLARATLSPMDHHCVSPG
jgi:hypothetical protein